MIGPLAAPFASVANSDFTIAKIVNTTSNATHIASIVQKAVCTASLVIKAYVISVQFPLPPTSIYFPPASSLIDSMPASFLKRLITKSISIPTPVKTR